MATMTAAAPQSSAPTRMSRAEVLHQIVVWGTAFTIVTLLFALVVNGAAYYPLSMEERPLSPLHAQLRSSGTVGLKLGILSMAMFGVLFLYPLRKRWPWLARIGATRRWLRLHVLFGITTPLVATFHTSFRWHGLAGVAYWTMIAVALSGFVGRYVYAKVPRSLSSAKLTAQELEAQTGTLSTRLQEQRLFRPEDLEPLLALPAMDEIRHMNLLHVLWRIFRMDLARPFRVSRLRRHALPGSQRIATLGGWLPSHDPILESVVTNVRRLARLRTAVAFLHRTERILHLWHVIHRPFSITFLILIAVHVGVALSVGVR